MSVNEKMTAIANAIRGKTGGTSALTLDQMATEIAGIQTGTGGSSGDSNDTIIKIVERYWGGNGNPRDLTEFVVPAGCQLIGPYAFAGCQSLKTITIPDTVTKIGNYAFSSGLNLELVKLPDTVTSIGNNVFTSSRLPNFIKLPDALQTIGQSAFQYVASFGTDTMEIPAGVTTIGRTAFQQGVLTTITFKGTPTSIAADSFKSSAITTINVPWAEGAVANVPWGATNATINYNYTGG